MRSIVVRCILTFAALDLVFNPLVTAAYVQLLGFRDTQTPFLIFGLMWLVKVGSCAWFFSYALRGVDGAEESTDPDLLKRADARVQELPKRFGLFYACTWSFTYGVGFLLVHTLYPELRPDPRAWSAVALVVCAVWFGGLAFAFPIASMLTSSTAGQFSVRARELGVTLARSRSSLQIRIGFIAFALGVGPTMWMMSLGYMKQLTAHSEQSAVHAQWAAEVAAKDWLRTGKLAASDTTGPADVVLERRIVDGPRAAELTAWLPESSRNWLARQFEIAPSGVLLNEATQRVVAYTRVDDAHLAVVSLDTGQSTPSGFIFSAALFAVVVGLWAPLCAVTLGRSVSGPLERLTSSAREIVEEGKQSEMTVLPVPRADEVGVLSERFNDLIDMMRDLSTAADAIASGDLQVRVERNGELPDAFRRMLDSLRTMVSQIRETSVTLGSAATEIFAATQEQEAAATSQSSAMEEISRTMDSLSESAAHVSDSVKGVLSNAERALDNTDDMVGRIGQLSAHAGRITEILDVIREIADRSDLLALNGSLEASRAGEGGQGFALVAAEMRRLAERVTASVEDIKRLVADIRDSGSSTVMATEESKRLAQETTEAARQITFVTQQQRSGTEQVSQSVKNIADVVTQAVSATSQTRTSAEGLKLQADRLADLVKRFEVREARAAE